MAEGMIGFIIWAACGVLFLIMGGYAFFAGKPMGFWSNTKVPEIADVKSYNRAVGILFCVYGIVFILLGLPLLAGRNSPYILISILGVMFETLAIMIAYTRIEQKYRKKQ